MRFARDEPSPDTKAPCPSTTMKLKISRCAARARVRARERARTTLTRPSHAFSHNFETPLRSLVPSRCETWKSKPFRHTCSCGFLRNCFELLVESQWRRFQESRTGSRSEKASKRLRPPTVFPHMCAGSRCSCKYRLSFLQDLFPLVFLEV